MSDKSANAAGNHGGWSRAMLDFDERLIRLTAMLEIVFEHHPEMRMEAELCGDERVKEVRAEHERQRIEQERARLEFERAQTKAKLDAKAAIVEAQQPGWRLLVKSPDFARWLETQPTEIVKLTASEDPADAIRVLKLYGDSSRAKRSMWEHFRDRVAKGESWV